jgi:RNA polymerase sigma-70 factor (ECF subfamily)
METRGVEDSVERFSFDADYVRRLREGDGATEEHFAAYFGDLIRIKAVARLRSVHAADDVRQETLLRVLRNLRQGVIEHPERLGAYVNTVSNHVMQEMFRRDRRAGELPDEAGEIPSGQASAETGLLQDERTDLVRRALSELAVKDRELLQRIFLDEEDKDAVCEEFGVTREYLRVLLHRARSRLRTALNRGRAAV